MSTPTTPGSFSSPASGWYPNLSGSSTMAQAVGGITQSYQLIYSLRDTVNQLQATVARLVQYGTAQNREQANPQAVPNGALFYDTDDGDIYQSRLAPQSTTRQWVELVSAGGATGPEGPQGPAGPAGPAGPVNPQNFVYNPPGAAIGQLYQNLTGLPMWVKVMLSFSGGADAGIAAQISPTPTPNQVVATTFIPSSGVGGIQVDVGFIVPVDWFYTVVSTPGATISAWSVWY